MEFKVKYRYRRVPDEMLLNDIKRIAKKLKKDRLARDEYKQLGKFSDDTIMWRFGSWNNAVIKAGLKPSLNKYVTTGELLENIADVWLKLGRQPVCNDMRSEISGYSYSTYAKRFGSWIKSLEAFEQYIKSRRRKKNKPANESKKLKELAGKTVKLMRKTSRRITIDLRYRVLTRDNYRCVLCGRSPANERGVKLHVDHIKPWSKGGESTYNNLRTLCEKCNIGKGNKCS